MDRVRSARRVGREEVVEVALCGGECVGGADVGFCVGIGFDGGIHIGGAPRGRHFVVKELLAHDGALCVVDERLDFI